MASIQNIGRGYRAQVYVGGQRDSKLFRLKREAEAWAFQREKELRAGKTDGDKTLGDALKRYADEISQTHRGERWETIRIAAFLADPTFPAAKRLAELVPDDIGAWQDARLKRVTTSTIHHEIFLVSSALESARREWRWIDTNPVRDVRKLREPEHREVLITLSQTRIMLRTMGYQAGCCRSVGQVVARARLSGFTFHDTRHTAATRLARRVDVLTLCKIFGWKIRKRR